MKLTSGNQHDQYFVASHKQKGFCMINPKDICAIIKHSRQRRRLSQKQVAKHLGITQASYSRMEGGTQPIDLVCVAKIIELFARKDAP
jgi:predicted transcriptional regulator